jgi:hypothetical protein
VVGAAVAVVLILASGGLMLATGMYVENEASSAATAASLAAGVVAQVGFVFARRAEPPRAAGGKLELRWSWLALAIALSFVAGGFMFAAGFVAADGYWYAAPLIAFFALPTIIGSYLLDRHARGV